MEPAAAFAVFSIAQGLPAKVNFRNLEDTRAAVSFLASGGEPMSQIRLDPEQLQVSTFETDAPDPDSVHAPESYNNTRGESCAYACLTCGPWASPCTWESACGTLE